MRIPVRLRTGIVVLCAVALVSVPIQTAWALIMGGTGNAPLRDPGWPKGAAVIFNTQSRIAYWEGPPFGGGQWHAECRGDAKALSEVLADFAKLEVNSKRVVLHADSGPPAQLDVYTGGNIKWDEVKVPKGLKIVDQRLEAHGFTVADGVVLEGAVTDLATKKPLAAKIMLQRVESQPKGGDQHPTVAETVADAQGRWVLKKAPAGWHRVVIEADGYVARVAGHGNFDDQPKWNFFGSGLARSAPVAGRVIDDVGKPLADVEVRFGDVTAGGSRYEAALGQTVKTDKEGRFHSDQLPVGKSTIWLHKPGYIRPGLGQSIATPAKDVELKMTQSARMEVTVDFTGKERPAGYIVRIEPEGGEKIGSYGGSGNINAKNQMIFEHVPPGRYLFSGRPNPGSDAQQTDPVMVELKGGDSAKLKLHAK